MKKIVAVLRGLFGPGRASAETEFEVFRIRCSACGETVTLRVNRLSDLQPDWDSEGGGFLLIKEAQDARCFRLIRLNARFDADKRLVMATVTGGELLKDED